MRKLITALALFVSSSALAHTVELQIEKKTMLKIDSQQLKVRHAEKAVLLTLEGPDAATLKAITTEHQGEKLAIVVDGKLQSEPIIRDPIQSGRIAITLLKDDDAVKLAKLLSEK
jgi:preprotein translocase subunit SecD